MKESQPHRNKWRVLEISLCVHIACTGACAHTRARIHTHTPTHTPMSDTPLFHKNPTSAHWRSSVHVCWIINKHWVAAKGHLTVKSVLHAAIHWVLELTPPSGLSLWNESTRSCLRTLATWWCQSVLWVPHQRLQSALLFLSALLKTRLR